MSRLVNTTRYIFHTPVDDSREFDIHYDYNGNLTSLTRSAEGRVINYAYQHNGNQMISQTARDVVSGSPVNQPAPQVTTGFTYDANGNLKYDAENDFNISYNHLNLLQKVEQSGTTLANYTYLADGTKVSALNESGDGNHKEKRGKEYADRTRNVTEKRRFYSINHPPNDTVIGSDYTQE